MQPRVTSSENFEKINHTQEKSPEICATYFHTLNKFPDS